MSVRYKNFSVEAEYEVVEGKPLPYTMELFYKHVICKLPFAPMNLYLNCSYPSFSFFNPLTLH